jgi:hypothetical protein
MNNLRTYKNTKKKYTGQPKMKPEIEENPTKKTPNGKRDRISICLITKSHSNDS